MIVVPPPKTTMEPENEPWKRRFLLNTIFRFHVSFRGGKCFLGIPHVVFVTEVFFGEARADATGAFTAASLADHPGIIRILYDAWTPVIR